MSLGIDAPHGDFPIATSSACLGMRTANHRKEQFIEDHRTLCSLEQTQPQLHKRRCEKMFWGGGVINNEAFVQQLMV